MRRDLKWAFAPPTIHLLVDVEPIPDKLERTEKLLFAGMTRATVRLELVVKEANPLHAVVGGTLIRSCDVYQRLGICLPDWVAKTRGFTEAVGAYERVRDHAYEEMARLLEESLAVGETLAILDAVHCERAKCAIVFDLCRRYATAPVLVWCRCDDPAETERRLAARRGREAEPEREASDVSVYRHIASLWDDPLEDNLTIDIAVHDSCAQTVHWARHGESGLVEAIHAAVVGTASVRPSGNTIRLSKRLRKAWRQAKAIAFPSR